MPGTLIACLGDRPCVRGVCLRLSYSCTKELTAGALGVVLPARCPGVRVISGPIPEKGSIGSFLLLDGNVGPIMSREEVGDRQEGLSGNVTH